MSVKVPPLSMLIIGESTPPMISIDDANTSSPSSFKRILSQLVLFVAFFQKVFHYLDIASMKGVCVCVGGEEGWGGEVRVALFTRHRENAPS
mmetsp:Transcript_27401/g.40739  ORF Transcript_27401/g.40739 Transcript_27401/m.40739 type:complete len:92 (-) Transcript_27401:2-277(-)